MGKGKSREYQCQEIGKFRKYSFQFNLVEYLTRDVCVGIAGLRMQDSWEGDIKRILMSASQIVHFFNIVEMQG